MEGCFYMKPKTTRVVLFANGNFPAPDRLLSKLTKNDFLIAVDGGLNHLTTHNLTPNLIIGDLDSTQPDDLLKYQSKGVEVRKYPVEKDETDLELALEYAIKRNPKSIWVVAALGDRLDMTLANVYLLTHPQFRAVDLRLIDGLMEVFLISEQAALDGNPEDRVSLIPLTKRVTGITTKGLYYPLHQETLYRDQTRGISNRMSSPSASVAIQKGLLLCIHEFSDSQKG
jgi:thiamine pyrophosphokinase